jgi:hypothetical protein
MGLAIRLHLYRSVVVSAAAVGRKQAMRSAEQTAAAPSKCNGAPIFEGVFNEGDS